MNAQLLMVLFLVSSVQLTAIADSNLPIAKPTCADHCGNVSIPYPFGIGAGCFSTDWFEIKCNESSPNPIPYLSKVSSVEVKNITVEYSFNNPPTVIVGLPPLTTCVTETHKQQYNTSVDLTGSPFKFLGGYNLFTVEGCSGTAVLRDQHNQIVAGCGTVCQDNNSAIPSSGCFGVQCCQTLLSSAANLSFYHIDAYLQDSSGTNGDCIRATLIQSDLGDEYAGILSRLDEPNAVAPVVLSWTLTEESDYHSP